MSLTVQSYTYTSASHSFSGTAMSWCVRCRSACARRCCLCAKRACWCAEEHLRPPQPSPASTLDLPAALACLQAELYWVKHPQCKQQNSLRDASRSASREPEPLPLPTLFHQGLYCTRRCAQAALSAFTTSCRWCWCHWKRRPAARSLTCERRAFRQVNGDVSYAGRATLSAAHRAERAIRAPFQVEHPELTLCSQTPFQ